MLAEFLFYTTRNLIAASENYLSISAVRSLEALDRFFSYGTAQ
jgi:hypothetical protein